MSTINTVNQQTNQAYSQDTAASAKKSDVEAFEAALNNTETEPLDTKATEQLDTKETIETLIGGMIKMSLGGVQELFKKEMLGKPEDKV